MLGEQGGMGMRKKRKVKEQEGTGEPVPPERPAGESRLSRRNPTEEKYHE